MSNLSLRYIAHKLRDMRLSDWLAVAPMLMGRIVALKQKEENKNLWAITERKDEARDNGYAFFKYLRENHPEQNCIYFIDKRSPDYSKVKQLGRVEQFGGIRHWAAYFTSQWLVSSQGGSPNGYLGVYLERMGFVSPRHAFLQHGITINNASYLHAERNPACQLFTAGAYPELDYISRFFGYEQGIVEYTGFARFDNYCNAQIEPGLVVVMPTWRKWLRHPSERHSETESDPISSQYLHAWRDFLRSPRLQRIAEAFHLDVVFYPHSNMRAVMDCSQMCGPNVRYVDDADVQDLLKSAQLLVTDYSSVFFDFAYMCKPTLFYQFDESQFRKYHYAQGWFDYHASLFGTWCGDTESALDAIEQLARAGFPVKEGFAAEHAATFPLHDACNCARIYEALLERSGKAIRELDLDAGSQEAISL